MLISCFYIIAQNHDIGYFYRNHVMIYHLVIIHDKQYRTGKVLAIILEGFKDSIVKTFQITKGNFFPFVFISY